MPDSADRTPQRSQSPTESPEADSTQRTEAVIADTTPPYSVFSTVEKAWIVGFATTAALFSPLSANIYFPVLPELSQYYSRPSSSINLTVTVYMIFQGVAPMVSGPFADFFGRRPVLIGLFVIYIFACVGIAFQKSFVALLILRCMQSSGSSGMVAISSGIVADIASRKHRGGYMGYVNLGVNLGPAVGPIIGGLIGERAGWRWIFWFLSIFAGAFVVCLATWFPETSRNIVDNGSVEPPTINKSVIQLIRRRKDRHHTTAVSGGESKEHITGNNSKERKLRMPNLLENLKAFLEKDIAILLTFMSIVYAAYYCFLASFPSLLQEIYGYTTLQVGLCFIPSGVGCLLASLAGGKLLDHDYKSIADKQPLDAAPEDFPIEAARIRSVWVAISISISAILCYGWTLYKQTSVAAPLVLSFIIAVGICFVFISFSTLLVDLYPKSPSSVTANNNLSRCLLGAGGTAVIDPMLKAMGVGWCFTFIGLVCVAMIPLLWLEKRYGCVWRKQRQARISQKANEN